MIFRNAFDMSGQQPPEQFNAVIEALVGRSDNTTLPDLDPFWPMRHSVIRQRAQRKPGTTDRAADQE